MTGIGVFCGLITTPQMPLTSVIESTKNQEIDHAEGGLFLCESDLLSALHFSHSTSGQPTAQLGSEAAGALLTLKGQLGVGAC